MTLNDLVPEYGNPFSETQLGYIFDPHPTDISRLLKKESNNVEYKKTFHFESFDNHARTFAGFANTKGGYFVFGVDDESRELLGLQDDRFDRLDPTRPTKFLNQKFAPEIHWTSHLHTYDGKQFGLIYIYPSAHKPVIALENGNRIIEGQIFYRYNGLTETIRYAELRQIMDDIRRIEQELWLRHMRRLANIGVDNAAVFNFEDGVAHGKSGAFIIDADLLSRIQFLREGEFVERIGAPAIKIVGNAEILATGTISQSTSRLSAKALIEPDIYEVFLEQQSPQEPSEYIRAICSFPSIYIPIYYFAYLAGFSMGALQDFILDTPFSRKHELLKRINDDPSHHRYYQSPKTDEAAKRRIKYLTAIYSKQFNLDHEYNPQKLFQGIQLLTANSFDVDYLFSIMRLLFERHWKEGTAKTDLRKAISHLDYLVYFPMINLEDENEPV